jgi:hypothetical protein
MSAATQGPGKVFFVSTIRLRPHNKQGPTARAVKDQSTDSRETGLWYRPASLPPGPPPRRHLGLSRKYAERRTRPPWNMPR